MQSVKFDGLKEFDRQLENILNEIPSAKRELHENVAELLKQEVDKEISTSGMNDSMGKIKNWQEATVGSRGGYAAVHSRSGEVGDNSPGAITNYLEHGHKIREPKGNTKYYRPRIKKAYVDGFHFYESAGLNIEAKVIALAEEFIEEILEKMEG